MLYRTAHATPCALHPPTRRNVAKSLGEQGSHRPRHSLPPPCPSDGALPSKARMLTPQRGAAYHTDMLPGAGTWGPSHEYAPNTAKTRQRIVPRGVRTPTSRPLAPPPLVWTRPDTVPRKGGARNPMEHTPTDPPAPPAALRKATSDGCPHTSPSGTLSNGTEQGRPSKSEIRGPKAPQGR